MRVDAHVGVLRACLSFREELAVVIARCERCLDDANEAAQAWQQLPDTQLLPVRPRGLAHAATCWSRAGALIRAVESL